MAMRIKLLLAGLLLAALAASHYSIYQWGSASARHTEHAACQQVQIDGLHTALDSVNQLTASANRASRELAKAIQARHQADQQSTREIRHALALTVGTRADCVFDDDSMRQLTAARDRATAAAAAGVNGTVPATSGTR